MNETFKAMARRRREHESGVFPWMDLFKGKGIDVGCGPDKVPFDNFQGFDTQDGDANRLSEYFKPETFDCLHASQCLEHMNNPVMCLKDWLKVVKKGGHAIISFPDFDLYEKRMSVSKWNPDHKAFFSLWRKGFPGIRLPFIHVPDMLKIIEKTGAKTLRCELVTTNYDWNAPEDIDQTFDVEKMVEAWIEVVILKTK